MTTWGHTCSVMQSVLQRSRCKATALVQCAAHLPLGDVSRHEHALPVSALPDFKAALHARLLLQVLEDALVGLSCRQVL